MKNTFIIFLILCLCFPLYSQTFTTYIGNVNNSGVRVREEPSLDSAIVGQLEQGMTVTVLGRSQYRMYLDGFNSYWLRIRNNNVEGWAYGAYINLTNSQYESLPVLFRNNPTGVINLNFNRSLPILELRQIEKETISLQANRFIDTSVQEYYNAIVRAFDQQQSLRPFFLNTASIGFSDTANWIYRDASVLSDYIQSSYADNITIGQLNILSEFSGAFVINGFSKRSTMTGIQPGSITINIKIIENADFTPLNGKTIIDYIVINPYSLDAFISRNWGDAERFYSISTNLPIFSRNSPWLQMILDVD